MNRRELLKLIAAATGGVVIGGEFLLSGCKNPESNPFEFTEENISFLDEVAETILPQTNTAGAKAAGVGRFMTVMVNDCYKKEDQEIFHKGINSLEDACKKMHGHGFMKATPEERKALLISVDKETKEYIKKKTDFDNDQKEKEKEAQEKGTTDFKKQTMSTHYFQQLKQLAIFGYFTSEKGRKEGLRYTPVPGKYETIDYKKGDKSFAGLT
ncbi:MAG TPA: gluconate 2-dehydrogenase subunit 3 family protein [Chitinophagaceae bacterium]|nr:gluconate 2-dehydrogenase subunit 3 family protein [Chitinophagaceae bacterium]